MQKRGKWLKTQENVRTGQLILVKAKSVPFNQWHRRRVTKTFPGADGVVRVVEYVTPLGKKKKKHVNDLCVLSTDEEIVKINEAAKFPSVGSTRPEAIETAQVQADRTVQNDKILVVKPIRQLETVKPIVDQPTKKKTDGQVRRSTRIQEKKEKKNQSSFAANTLMLFSSILSSCTVWIFFCCSILATTEGAHITPFTEIGGLSTTDSSFYTVSIWRRVGVEHQHKY